MYKTPYKDKIQNNKGSYIGKTPIDPLLANKHIINLNKLDFYPKSFVLYNYSNNIIKKVKKYNYKYYIIKPALLSKGKNITISKNNNLIKLLKKYDKNLYPLLIQQYIEKPMLLRDKKFDIRVYVLFIDNKVYINKILRFRQADKKYDYNNITNIQSGLTNFSLHENKENRLDNTLFFNLYKEEYNNDPFGYLNNGLMNKIITIIKDYFNFIKEKVKMDFWYDSKNNYFNLYGFDIFPDNNGKLWLLEVNKNPLLDSQLTLVIEDMIRIILKKKQKSFIHIV